MDYMYCTYLYIYIYTTQLYYMTLFHYIILLLVGGFKCYCTSTLRKGWLAEMTSIFLGWVKASNQYKLLVYWKIIFH